MFSLINNDDVAMPSFREMWARLGALRWLLLLAFVVILLPRVLHLYTDALWFGSLKQAAVFWTSWKFRLGAFVVFFALTLLILRLALSAMERTFDAYPLGGSLPRFDGSPVQLMPETFMRSIGWSLSVVWALLIGVSMSARWELWALFFQTLGNATQSTQLDPIFARPIDWYFFIWPVLHMVGSWLSGLAFLIFLFAAAWAFFAYISRLSRTTQEEVRRRAYFYTGLSLAFLCFTLAFRAWLARYAMLWRGDDSFTGPGYVDVNINLPAQLVLVGVLVVAALVALWNGARARLPKVFIASLVAPVAVYFISGLVANYVSNFVVKPNQLELEERFIKRNIEMTRAAFSLDKIQTREFPVKPGVEAFQLDTDAAAQSTVQNVRLWDWRALEAHLAQTQTLRPYYHFPDVDVDRYLINGRMRQVMIGARELDTSSLPANSRNWVNERLTYTHGYGVVMNTASDFTPEGRPRYILSEMPVRSSAPEIKLTRPEIYFGQSTNQHVYVKTRHREFNYPGSRGDAYSSYQGSGGIPLGGFLRRTILAWTLGDLSKIPFSDAITPETRVLLHRQITDRVTRLAPFLTLDHDPYVVIGDDGKLYWMLDAYTSSLYHPYSAHVPLRGNWANYLRNSVKIVVDAYDGSVDFYVFEPNDPVIRAWRGVYPTLFKDESAMPRDLRTHVRYPELFFRVQSHIFELYHTTDTSAFFQRNDMWSVAQLSDTSGAQPAVTGPTMPGVPAAPGARLPGLMPGANPALQNQAVQRPQSAGIEPYFLLLRLPDVKSSTPPRSDESEFVLSVPFTPANRSVILSAWLAGRSDAEHYGKLALYSIPDTNEETASQSRSINAPQQIRVRINTDPVLRQQLTLWNSPNGGSRVLWGNLLVIPLGRGLMYVQPLFLQSENSPIPELVTVVLATQNRLVHAPTYAQALEKLLGDAAPLAEADAPRARTTRRSTTTSTGTTRPSTSGASPRNDLINRAAQQLADYQRLTAQGKYGEAGQKLEALKGTLNQLQQNP